MKIITTARVILLPILLTASMARGADTCPANAAQVNASNSLLLLGGTAKGPVKQVVMGEFGKDVNQQKRLLGDFDRCGALLRATLSFDKNEGNRALRMVQNITRVATGWQADYVLAIFELKQGRPIEISNKQGSIHYLTGKRGTITHSSEAFLLQGKKGFTETINSYDGQQRLIKSVARGSDAQANGEYHYRWNAENQLIASRSGNSEMQWTYDEQKREKGLLMKTHTPGSELVVQDECQLWDARGNCTLSYSHEREIFAQGEVLRNISAACRFEYWDEPEGAEK